jgi:20S proteasome alpha/beta subunit
MRIMFRENGYISVAEVSYATYDDEEKALYVALADGNLVHQEFYMYGVGIEKVNDILEELYKTGMYDFTKEPYDMELV